MSEQIKAYLLLQRARFAAEIDRLQLRIEAVDAMISELPDLMAAVKDTPVVNNNPIIVTNKGPAREVRKRGTYKPRVYDTPTTDIVKTALEAAGEEGLTARELADLANMPNGTASGRLSNMKKQGLVMHIAPKYFAIHSEPQDNNHQ